MRQGGAGLHRWPRRATAAMLENAGLSIREAARGEAKNRLGFARSARHVTRSGARERSLHRTDPNHHKETL